MPNYRISQRIKSPADATKWVEKCADDALALAGEMATHLGDSTFDDAVIDFFDWVADVIEQLQAVKNWMERYMHTE